MKKVFLLLIFLVLVSLCNTAFCATKQDIVNALHDSYYVSEKQPAFKLPAKYIQKGEDYLNEHQLTSEQYSRILAAINEGVAFAREVGHTNYKKYTKEQYNRALNIILEACAAADVNISEEIQKDEEIIQKTEEVTNSQNKQTTVEVKEAVTKDNVPVKIEKKEDEIKVIVSGEVVSDVTIDENNNYVTSSGEILVYSGDITKEEIKIVSDNSNTSSTKSQKGMFASKVDRNIALIFVGLFLLIIINIFLIRLIFKKKWNKIVKRILESILVVIVLALIVVICISLYYLDEIKLVYQLYYFLK